MVGNISRIRLSIPLTWTLTDKTPYAMIASNNSVKLMPDLALIHIRNITNAAQASALNKTLDKSFPTLPYDANGCRLPHFQPVDSACASD